MSKQLKPTERSQIVVLFEEEISVNKIAEKFNIGKSTVYRTIEKYYKNLPLSILGIIIDLEFLLIT